MHLPCLLLALVTLSPQDSKRPLTIEDGDAWRNLSSQRLSETGAWFSWQEQPADSSDGLLQIVSTTGTDPIQIERGSGLRFDFGEGFAACTVSPARAAQDAWKDREKLKKEGGEAAESVPEHEPKSQLLILELAQGSRHEVERVRSFSMPDKAGGWIAYLLEKPEKKKDKKDKEGEEGEAEEEEGEEGQEEPAKPEEEQSAEKKEEEEEEEEEDGPKPKKDSEVGSELVLRALASGEEQRFESVMRYTFSEDGRFLVFITSTKDGAGDGVHRLALGEAEPVTLLTGRGKYTSLAISEDGERLAFLTDRDDQERDEKEDKHYSLYLAAAVDAEARLVAGSETEGLPVGWGVSKNRGPRFSEDGQRLLFGSAPLPEPKPEEQLDRDKVVLDVWSWTDDLIQPQQLRQQSRERDRSYLAVAHLYGASLDVVQLGSSEVPEVSLAEGSQGRWALGTSNLRWRYTTQWDTDVLNDAWRIDVRTGERTMILDGRRGRVSLSPGGRYVSWWDGEDRQYWVIDLEAAEPQARRLTAAIPHPLWNELHDSPSLPRSYGTGGWLAGDAGLLINDKHDVWLVDPLRPESPRCVTDGLGRAENMRFRPIDLDREEQAVSVIDPMLLSAFHLHTKRAGFYRHELLGGGAPSEVLMADKSFSGPSKARGGDTVWFTRQDFQEYPDAWIADLSLTDARKVTNANPQQADYRWGTSELVEWRSAENVPLQGILYKPDDFDEERQYPLLVYFYERNSNSLHRHQTPVAGGSSVRYPYYTSNDYMVFVPDIPYRVGFPGESCADAVLPGILKLIDDGNVDANCVGVQGHSWGGYQIAYLVTRTDMFAAAVSGAPVSNMTSAYGGIRYSSGMSRQFQYEKTQSRLGGTLWEVPDRYIDNSPVFRADRVSTPVVMLHNDEDGAVPWTQGIEYFAALRRLNKPVWLFNYNGEGHGLRKYAHRRDYATRMSQFFAHYLKGAPAPEWIVQGIPAVDKGRTLGLNLVTPAADE